MNSVKVRFIKDTQSVHTGHSMYRVGTTAHFFEHQTDVLVEQGRAVVIDTPPPDDISPALEPKLVVTISPEFLDKKMAEYDKPYSEMTVKQLRACAIAAGMPASGLRKAELINMLERSED